MMTSFHYNYQNTLRQAIVLSIFYFVKNRSCVTHLHNKDCSEMHSGSCSQMTSSCKCPIGSSVQLLFVAHVPPLGIASYNIKTTSVTRGKVSAKITAYSSESVGKPRYGFYRNSLQSEGQPYNGDC